MTDAIEDQNTTPKSESEPKPMAVDTEDHPQHTQKLDKPNLPSFSIWPPRQRTRDAVVSRLIETLSAPSVLSKRYGTIPEIDAADAARRIEDEAFSAVSAAAGADEDGMEILQAYSKEISRRMLETVKARSGPSGSESVPDGPADSATTADTTTMEVSSVGETN